MILKALFSLDRKDSSASAAPGSSNTASSGNRGFQDTQEAGQVSTTVAVSPDIQLHCMQIYNSGYK